MPMKDFPHKIPSLKNKIIVDLASTVFVFFCALLIFYLDAFIGKKVSFYILYFPCVAAMSPARSGVNLAVLAVVFVLAGIYVATEEALEDSLAAELVDKEQHGMGFGALATVNGVGDFVSSIVVGALWTVWGTQVAFAYSTVLFAAGAVAVWRLRKA